MAESHQPTTAPPSRKMSFSEDDEVSKKARAKRKRDDDTGSVKNSEGGDSDTEPRSEKRSLLSLQSKASLETASDTSESVRESNLTGNKRGPKSGSFNDDASDSGSKVIPKSAVKKVIGGFKSETKGKSSAGENDDNPLSRSSSQIEEELEEPVTRVVENHGNVVGVDEVSETIASSLLTDATKSRGPGAKRGRKSRSDSATSVDKYASDDAGNEVTTENSVAEFVAKAVVAEIVNDSISTIEDNSEIESLVPSAYPTVTSDDDHVGDFVPTGDGEHDDDNDAGDEIEEDMQDTKDETAEQKTEHQAKRKRRKSSELMATLAAAGIQDQLDLLGGGEDGEGLSPRYQSSRAAAQIAKTKLANKSRTFGGTVDESAKVSSANGGKDDDKVAKLKSPRAWGRGKSNATAVAAAVEAEWVACDRCGKWRKLPTHIRSDTLPDEWYCSLNEWDPAHNDCEAAEETYDSTTGSTVAGGDEEEDEGADDVAQGEETPRREAASRQTPNRGTNSAGRRGAGAKAGEKSVERGALSGRRNAVRDTGDGGGYDSDNREEAAGPARSSRRTAASGNRGRGGGYTIENVEWVQCNRCSKWRRVPPHISASDLPDIWECRQNTWAVSLARCSAKEETDADIVGPTVGANNAPGTAVVAPVATTPVVHHGQRGRKSNQDSSQNVNTVAAGGTGTASGAPTKTVTQWVQCERRNCKKWRKIPASVDLSSLPDKWYCEMNRWDPDRASCDGPEETDSESEQKGHSGPRSQLILANSKGPTQLSYRRIIFGVDGRMRPGYSEKNKNGFGIFSFTECAKQAGYDDYIEPTRKLSYWWSSCYQLEAQLQAAASVPVTTTAGAKRQAVVVDTEVIESTSSNTQSLQSSYLLDAVRRITRPKATSVGTINGSSLALGSSSSESTIDRCTQLPIPLRKRAAKYTDILANLTIRDRMRLEAVAVRSLLHAIPQSGAHLTAFKEFISNTYFHSAELEACRMSLSGPTLLDVIHRLEQNGEVDITLSTEGDLVIQLVRSPSLLQILQGSSQETTVGTAWAKKGVPMKLRKSKF